MVLKDKANLSENIDQKAQTIESYTSRAQEVQNGDDPFIPSCWWFLSTAFPMIAGTLGPVASAFSICSLAEPWRQQLVPGGDIQDASSVPDPSWLSIVEAIQLFVGLTSNLFLLLNMARQIRSNLALPITIIGWYISALCRISLSATASRPLKDIGFSQDELIWSQSFYYGMWAAILYFVDASLLTITFWGASTGHYRKDLILTVSERTLMLQTIMLLIYLLLGAYIFSEIESWHYLDAVYWTVVTLFTVGFGDYYPTTDLGRALLIPFALTGIITLGLIINSVRNLILEHGRRCVAARIDDRKRRKIIQKILRRSDDRTLEPIREESKTSVAQSNKAPGIEFERRKAEFALMRKIQVKSSSHRGWVAMAISTFSWLILWLVGAIVFEKAEKSYQNWSYFDAFYFCFEAWTTIGYGDLAPVSNAGRSFYVFWSLLALPTMTVLISHASDSVVRIIRDGTILLGNITILPNDEGFVGNMKYIICKITFGKVFPGHQDSASSEPAAPSKNIGRRSAGNMIDFYGQSLGDDDRGCPSDSIAGQRVHRHELPTGTDFHLLLISEIQVVATHLKEPKPHRYTFEQWAWYLSLAGEDEHSPQTHCKVNLEEDRQEVNNGDSHRGLTWSWVGHRSPLINSQEESEWILGRLMDRLQESLLAERRS